jgi:hypothetical protein
MAVVVDSSGRDDVPFRAQLPVVLNVTADLGHVVIVLVATVDRAFGLRVRVQVVESVGQSVLRIEVEPVL